MKSKTTLLVWFLANIAFAGRIYTAPPIVFSGEFNKSPSAGAWPIQAITEVMTLAVRNPSPIPQKVKIIFRFEGVSWWEFGGSGANYFPLYSQVTTAMTVTNGTSVTSGPGSLSGTTYQLTSDYVTIAPDTTLRIDASISYKGPVSAGSSYPHVGVRNSGSITIQVEQDRGLLTSTVRVYGSNGNAGLLEDSNLHAFAPYVLPLNGGRPF